MTNIIIHMRAGHQRALLSWMVLVLGLQLLVSPPRATALNPELDISQYAHRAWRVRDGFTRGAIFAIAQTSDGYLWLGTELGLYQFDGVRANLWQPPSGQMLPSQHIFGLLAARDGALWIATLKGLASWKDGKLTTYRALSGKTIHAIREDRNGTIWLTAEKDFSVPYICSIRQPDVQCYGNDGSMGHGAGINNIYEDRKGVLWAIARHGIWKWKPEPSVFYPLPIENDWLYGVAEESDGSLLIGLHGGIQKFRDGKAEPLPGLEHANRFTVRTLLVDHDGGIWIAAYHAGLVHIHDGKWDLFRQSDGLSSDEIRCIYEDHENNLWIASDNGLDQFRDTPIATFSLKQGVSSGQVRSVLADRDGGIWVSTPDGLDLLRRGQVVKTFGKMNAASPGSLFQDTYGRLWLSTNREIGFVRNDRFVSVAPSDYGKLQDVVEDASNDIWIADQEGGLLHVSRDKLVEQLPWYKLGHKDFALSLAADRSTRGLWLGFLNGTISYFADGKIKKTYRSSDGLGAGAISSLKLASDGALWAATDHGLSRLKGGRITTLDESNGLSCDSIHWMVQDDDRSLWLGTQCGVVRLDGHELDTWVRAADDGRASSMSVHPKVFDILDGARVHDQAYRAYHPVITKSVDGKLWFAPNDGVSMIDPHHLPMNHVPPPVHIEQIVADGGTYAPMEQLIIPPATRDLTVFYTALSLVIPEKVRFRYKLEGQDPGWKDGGNERQVRYTNLPPGRYTFHVIACNNDGVWNNAGASLHFSIAPAYYQTLWFRAFCAVVLLFLVWAAYLLRIRDLEAQFAARLEARVDERTRIARDIHDTLLQSFNALLLRLQTVSNVLPAQPEEAKSRIDKAIDQASDAITEGRDTLNELRSTGSSGTDLDDAIRNFAKELLGGITTEPLPEFRMRVEGTPLPMNPFVRDEVYRVASEAVRNAIRHANASRIDVEIRYDDNRLRLRVGDNGAGIDPAILNRDHKAGHWGLRGMRERAKLVGGTLEVWSQLNVGTEIDLSIPAASVYAKLSRVRWPASSRFRSG